MGVKVKRGTFHAVGVGPGDPELITLKAARILAEADAIFAPAGAQGGSGIARAIVEPLGIDLEKFRDVFLPMSRDREQVAKAYRAAAEEIARELEGGRHIAWINEGDPLFYGTSIYLIEELHRIAPEIPVHVIPGVTSIQASAARLGMELARWDDSVCVIPASHGLDRLVKYADEFSTVCLLKVSAVFDELLDRLKPISASIRTVYVERVGMAGERVVTDLESLRGQTIPYFSLVLIHRHKETR
ncbi:MAG: precorrin-2 C(20)-methyltransferase [Isosphaeraceae bacterium]